MTCKPFLARFCTGTLTSNGDFSAGIGAIDWDKDIPYTEDDMRMTAKILVDALSED